MVVGWSEGEDGENVRRRESAWLDDGIQRSDHTLWHQQEVSRSNLCTSQQYLWTSARALAPFAKEGNDLDFGRVGRASHVTHGRADVVLAPERPKLVADVGELGPGEGGDDAVAVEGAVVADVHGVGEDTHHAHAAVRVLDEHRGPGVAHGRITPGTAGKTYQSPSEQRRCLSVPLLTPATHGNAYQCPSPQRRCLISVPAKQKLISPHHHRGKVHPLVIPGTPGKSLSVPVVTPGTVGEAYKSNFHTWDT